MCAEKIIGLQDFKDVCSSAVIFIAKIKAFII